MLLKQAEYDWFGCQAGQVRLQVSRQKHVGVGALVDGFAVTNGIQSEAHWESGNTEVIPRLAARMQAVGHSSHPVWWQHNPLKEFRDVLLPPLITLPYRRHPGTVHDGLSPAWMNESGPHAVQQLLQYAVTTLSGVRRACKGFGPRTDPLRQVELGGQTRFHSFTFRSTPLTPVLQLCCACADD